jgi:hypothetical protein
MATRKIYDLAVAVGSYTDNSGQSKNRYQTIGAVMQKDDGGKFIIMERWFNPAGVPFDAGRGNSFLVSMFEPQARNHGGQGHQSGSGTTHGPNPQGYQDDIPF